MPGTGTVGYWSWRREPGCDKGMDRVIDSYGGLLDAAVERKTLTGRRATWQAYAS